MNIPSHTAYTKIKPAIFILLLALAFGLGKFFAVPGSMELGGKYESEMPSALITQIDRDTYRADFSTSDIGGCSGSLSTFGKRTSSHVIVFSPLTNDDAAKNCKVEAQWSEDYKTLEINESSCSYYHGAACDFVGKMKRVSKLAYFPELAEHLNDHPLEILRIESVQRALIALTGKRYNDLTDRLNVASAGELDDTYYCAQGLMPHMGGMEEAIFCLNHTDNTAQAAILSHRRLEFFGTGAPWYPIRNWATQQKKANNVDS